MASNREISRMFSLYAELLLLHRQDEKLAGMLSGAAYRMRNITDYVLDMEKTEAQKIFRPEIVHILTELKETGTIEALDELIQLTPAGLFEMMRIKGLGGKKLSVLWHTAKIDSLEILLEACKKNELSKIPGFGKKTELNIISAIEAYHSNQQRFHYASVAEEADRLVVSLQKLFKTKLFSLCGEIRRQSTTVSAIEIITAIESKKFSAPALRKLLLVGSSKKEQTTAHTPDEIPVIIYHTPKEKYYWELFIKTGTDAHTRKIQAKLAAKAKNNSEEAIYKNAGYPYIFPEMREDLAEWDFHEKKSTLLTADDIKGVVHNHTTWSDGVDTLPDFVNACRKKGYEYVVISDHSKNAHYAGGLKEDKLLRQLSEIDQLNKKIKGIKIFRSIECDILIPGDLDYDPSILELFDMVIVSVHQLLKMDEERATKRLIKAIENPFTTILGHMTGRQLLVRPGYPVNFKKVIDACAANQVVIEINANPYRLDMDWSHIPYALNKGAMISVNPDAHSIGEIDNIRWGVAAARKGGLTKDMTWNALSLKEIEKWLKKNNKLQLISG